MVSPLLVVAWECRECTTTNKGSPSGTCVNCRADNPHQYEILAGSAPAARMVDRYFDKVNRMINELVCLCLLCCHNWGRPLTFHAGHNTAFGVKKLVCQKKEKAGLCRNYTKNNLGASPAFRVPRFPIFVFFQSQSHVFYGMSSVPHVVVWQVFANIWGLCGEIKTRGQCRNQKKTWFPGHPKY